MFAHSLFPGRELPNRAHSRSFHTSNGAGDCLLATTVTSPPKGGPSSTSITRDPGMKASHLPSWHLRARMALPRRRRRDRGLPPMRTSAEPCHGATPCPGERGASDDQEEGRKKEVKDRDAGRVGREDAARTRLAGDDHRS